MRVDVARILKQLFYCEVVVGKRPHHKPRKRFKDVVKSNLKAIEIDVSP